MKNFWLGICVILASGSPFAIAASRRPEEAAASKALAARHPRLRVEMLDATDPKSIDGFAKRLEGLPIDVLVNNAGTIGEEGEQKLGQLDPSPRSPRTRGFIPGCTTTSPARRH